MRADPARDTIILGYTCSRIRERHDDPTLGGGETAVGPHKRDDESYDDVGLRLTGGDRWAGFGAFAETDADEAADGLAEIRDDMNEERSDRID